MFNDHAQGYSAVPKAGGPKLGTDEFNLAQTSVCFLAVAGRSAVHTSEVCAHAAKGAQDAAPTFEDLRGLRERACGCRPDDVVLRIRVQIRSVRERGRSPDGELGGVEAITKVSADISAGGDILGEDGGRLLDNLLPELVGTGDVVCEKVEEHAAALLGDHTVLQGVHSSRGGVGSGQAVRGDVSRVDGIAEALVDLLGGSSLVCAHLY